MKTQVLFSNRLARPSIVKGFAGKIIKRNSRFFAALLMNRGKFKAPVFANNFYVRIEITNLCNYNCEMCPRLKMNRKTGFLDTVLFQKIIDDCQQSGVRTVNLTSFGESMLDRELMQKIKYAKSKGIPYVYLTTNGSLLNHEKSIQIIENGLDEIRFSINAVTPDDYARMRSKYEYNQVIGNILNLLELKKQLNSQKPKVAVCFIKKDGQEDQAGTFINAWGGKVDSIHIQRFHNWAGSIEGTTCTYFVPCKRLWFTLNVLWDGSVTLCCADYEGKYIMGNLRESSIAEIWNSQVFQNARRKNLRADKDFVCSRCSLTEQDSLLWIKEII